MTKNMLPMLALVAATNVLAEESPSPAAAGEQKFAIVQQDSQGAWSTHEVVDTFFDKTKAKFAKHADASPYRLQYWCEIANGSLPVFLANDSAGGLVVGGKGQWEAMVDGGEVLVFDSHEKMIGVLPSDAASVLAEHMADGFVLKVRLSTGSTVAAAMEIPLTGFRESAMWIDESCPDPAAVEPDVPPEPPNDDSGTGQEEPADDPTGSPSQ